MMRRFPIVFFIFCSFSCSSQRNDNDGKNNLSSAPQFATILFDVPAPDGGSPYGYWAASNIGNLGDIEEYKPTKGQKSVMVPVTKFTSIAVGNSLYGFDYLFVSPGDSIVVYILDSTVQARGKTARSYYSANQFYAIDKNINQSESKQYLQALLDNAYDRKKALGNLHVMTLKKDEKQVSNALIGIIAFHDKMYQKNIRMLDSLYNYKSIDEHFYAWMTFRLKKDYISKQVRFYRDAKLNIRPIIDNIHLLNDELLDVEFNDYKAFLNQFYIPQIVLNGQTERKGSQLSYNYKKAFDSAMNYAKGHTLDYVRFFCLKNIKNEEPTEVFEAYLKKFEQVAADQQLVTVAKESLSSSWAASMLNQNPITDLNKTRNLSIESVLASNRGKVVFVDLWASWCAPCRAAMPAAAKLREQYKTADFVYIYLSLDVDFLKWKNAAISEKIDNYNHSFILANPKDAKFVKDLKVDMIPRHLIFDKKGKLVMANAPGADSGGTLEALLEKYL